jgi:hypothetical protein
LSIDCYQRPKKKEEGGRERRGEGEKEGDYTTEKI